MKTVLPTPINNTRFKRSLIQAFNISRPENKTSQTNNKQSVYNPCVTALNAFFCVAFLNFSITICTVFHSTAPVKRKVVRDLMQAFASVIRKYS